MQELDLIQCFVLPLENAGMEYMVSGSVATSLLGEPRFTADIDIALFLSKAQREELPIVFPENEFYLPPCEVIEIESQREVRGHFNIIHHTSGMKADVYPSRNHPFLPWALKNKLRFPYGASFITVAPPEYVILHKLAFYQEGHHNKHIRDITALCRMQNVDKEFLMIATKQLHLTNEWQLVLSALAEF
jgi:hypothetical protein